jgi:DNA-binding transcriptional regulator YiaG
MTGHRSFSGLVEKMSPKAQREIKHGTAKILAEMELAELREALALRQADLARMLKTTQAAVSRLERRGNVTIGSLRGYIEALGGRLELNAVLPGHTVKIAHAFKENAGRIGRSVMNSTGKSARITRRKRKTRRGARVYA